MPETCPLNPHRYYESMADETRAIAVRYGCSPTPATRNTTLEGLAGQTVPPAGYNLTCMEFDGCAAGLRVAYCTWNGIHAWPAVYTPELTYFNYKWPNITISHPFGSYIIARFMLEHVHGAMDVSPSCSSVGTSSKNAGMTSSAIVGISLAVLIIGLLVAGILLSYFGRLSFISDIVRTKKRYQTMTKNSAMMEMADSSDGRVHP